MDDTRTQFCAAIPASRSANSKEVRRSLCLPTPLVKNRRVGTIFFPNAEDPPVSDDARASGGRLPEHVCPVELSHAWLLNVNVVEGEFSTPARGRRSQPT